MVLSLNQRTSESLIFQYPTDEVDALILSSDGIGSFIDRTTVWSVEPVVCNVMMFKSTKGEFLKRRVIRYTEDLKKCTTGPVVHQDDLGLAGIIL
jgi:hypothetical protein